MLKCTRCSGWCENGGLCPDCRRSDELAEEQRNIAFDVAEAQERAQHRLQAQSHLDEIKRKLLDLAMESVERRDLSIQKAYVLMQAPSFKDNLAEFWNEIQSNDFLCNCYYQLIFTPAISFSDLSGILSSRPDYVINGAVQWLNSLPQDLHKSESITKFNRFIEELKKRQGEENALNEQRMAGYKREAEAREQQRLVSEARNNAQTKSAECRKRLIKNGLAMGSVVLFLTGFTLGGGWKILLWISEGRYLAVAICFGLAIRCSVQVFWCSKEYTEEWLYSYGNDELKWLLYWFSVALILLFTLLAWNKCSGAPRIILLTSAFICPFIPFIRGTLGAISIGVLSGLLSLAVSFLANGIFTFIFNLCFEKK